MFVDARLYKHYSMLEDLAEALVYDYSNLKKLLPVTFAVDLTVNDTFAMDWYDSFLVFLTEIHQRDFFTETKKISRKLPGVYQQTVNFIRPGGTLPLHADNATWARIKEKYPQAFGYTVAIGINMLEPQDVERQGIAFGDDRRSYGNKEIIAFEGTQEHRVWNNTDDWRISSVIDLDHTQWNIN